MTPGTPFVSSTPRWDVIRRGAVAVGVGIALLVVGGLLFGGRDVLAVAAPAARGTIPGDARFDAREGRYAILLNRLSLTGPPSSVAVAATTCVVGRADGSSVRVRGRRQTGGTESDFGRSIGSFDAVTGATTVACDYGATRHGRARFVVARRASALSVTIAVLVGAGLLLGAAGGGAIAWGFRNPVITRTG